MPLSDVKIRNAKPKAKPYKLADGEGMFLLVHSNGSKYWRFKYRVGGRERILAFGVYPDVGLIEAREKLLAARKTLAAGNDPAEMKSENKRLVVLAAGNSFRDIATEWLKHHEHQWDERYHDTVEYRVEHYLHPKLGDRPLKEITAQEILSTLRVVERRGALDLAQRLLAVCGQIFMYAIATGRAEHNPVPNLRGALKPPVRHHHASLGEADLPDFLKRLDAYDGEYETRLALRLVLLTFVRTVELRGAQWTEIDFDKAEWRIPAERMKMRDQLIVPLARQTVEVLRELKQHTGGFEYLFPNRLKAKKFMSENTMLYALYRMGYHSRTTVHGFRSTASTILNENGFMPDVIERQLAHTDSNKVRAAYNHAQYLPERRKMMQWWADYLDKAAGKKKAKRRSKL